MNKPPILCDKCDSNFSCLLDYDGENCRKTRSVEPTNADRLNAMSVEEKAEWFINHRGAQRNCPYSVCPQYDGLKNKKKISCCECWLDWLKQEAQVD